MTTEVPSAESRATSARDQLRARAEALDPGALPATSAPAPTPCDAYFTAAFSFFALAAQTEDPELFLGLYQMGESHLQLGLACKDQLGDAEREDG